MTMESAIALFADLTNRQRPLFYGRLFERSIRLLRQSVFRRLIPIRTIEHAKTIFASSYDCAGTLELPRTLRFFVRHLTSMLMSWRLGLRLSNERRFVLPLQANDLDLHQTRHHSVEGLCFPTCNVCKIVQ